MTEAPRVKLLCALVALALGAAGPAAARACAHRVVDADPLFTARGLSGALDLRDVRTGMVIATSRNADAPVLPLSAVKLFLFASYWEHRRALPASLTVDAHELVAEGVDSAGRRLAIELRHRLGSAVLLKDLGRFGFPACDAGRTVNCTTLSSATSDAVWADAMSIGEADFRVTVSGLGGFVAAAGNRGETVGPRPTRMLRTETARQLQAAMLDTVQTGTATGIKDALGAEGRMGGKTGTGPAAANPYDGAFVGLVFDRKGAARYAVATYVRRGGKGGGAAAEISAAAAKRALEESCR
jgi:hypothetical protein